MKQNYFGLQCTIVFLFKDFDRCQEPKATEGPKACRWKSLGWNCSQNNTQTDILDIFRLRVAKGAFNPAQKGLGWNLIRCNPTDFGDFWTSSFRGSPPLPLHNISQIFTTKFNQVNLLLRHVTTKSTPASMGCGRECS